jgi:GT2 family glycosyltransferase
MHSELPAHSRLPDAACIVEDRYPSTRTVYDLVVVIVNWNVRDLLASCLESLLPATRGLSVHTVVVDNNSSDGSQEMLRERFSDLEVISSLTNLGFARANNLVLRQYQDRARYFLLLNPDTVVAADTFRTMLEFMDSRPDAGIAGCKVVKPEGTLDWPCKRSYPYPSVLFYRALGLDKRFPKSPRFGRYHLTYLDPDQIHEVDSVVGAFMMVRRECMQEVGVLDESFFMYGEDIEWCYRAKAAGWKVYYVPTTTIVHHKGQSTKQSAHSMISHWYAGTWKVYKQYLAPQYPFPVNALVWAGCLGMRAASTAFNFVRREKRLPSRR